MRDLSDGCMCICSIILFTLLFENFQDKKLWGWECPTYFQMSHLWDTSEVLTPLVEKPIFLFCISYIFINVVSGF